MDGFQPTIRLLCYCCKPPPFLNVRVCVHVSSKSTTTRESKANMMQLFSSSLRCRGRSSQAAFRCSQASKIKYNIPQEALLPSYPTESTPQKFSAKDENPSTFAQRFMVRDVCAAPGIASFGITFPDRKFEIEREKKPVTPIGPSDFFRRQKI